MDKSTDQVIDNYGDGDKVKIKKSLTLVNAVTMIVGAQIGGGIFIAPQGLLETTGSIGLALIVWVLCGVIAIIGGLCYAELGTLVRESGGEWAILNAAFGPPVAFTRAFVDTILSGGGSALIMQATAQYLLGPFFDKCGPPDLTLKLLSITVLWTAIYLNTSVKAVRVMTNGFFAAKVIALAMIVVGGIYYMSTTGIDKLRDPFKGTTTDGLSVSISFYSGLFAYAGWTNLNDITEEINKPRTTLPAGYLISNILVTALYLLVNISYFAVLTPQEMLESKAVAVDWGYHFVGNWSGWFSLIVALSCFGSGSVMMFTNTRTTMVVARAGHTVQVLSLVSVNDNSPIASLALRGVLATCFIFTGGVNTLLSFLSFTGWIFMGATFTGQLFLRRRADNSDKRRFRVPIFLPIFMILVSIYLTVIPLAARPSWLYLLSLAIISVALIVYFAFVKAKRSLGCFDKFTMYCQLLAKISIPDKDVS